MESHNGDVGRLASGIGRIERDSRNWKRQRIDWTGAIGPTKRASVSVRGHPNVAALRDGGNQWAVTVSSRVDNLRAGSIGESRN